MNVHELHRAFMEQVDAPDEDSCWLWNGNKTEKGYGRFRSSGVEVRAHRFAAAGFRVPLTGLLACHRCDVPSCVNPDHLYWGRPVDNTTDMMQKGRHVPSGVSGEKCPRSKLTLAQVGEIRAAHAQGSASYSTLAKAYGVTKQAIAAIITRKTWRQ